MRGRDWSPRREYPLHRNGLQTKCDVRHGSPSQSPDKVRSIRCLGSSLAGLHSSYLAYPHRPRSTCHHAGIGRDATQQDEPPDNRAISVRPRRVTSMETVRTLSGDCGVDHDRPVALCREINRTLTGMIRTLAGVHRTLSGKSRTMTGDWSPISRDGRLLRWRGKDSHRLYKGTPCRWDPATRPQRQRLRSKASVNRDAVNWGWIDRPNPAEMAQVP